MPTEKLSCDLTEMEKIDRARKATELLAQYSSKEASAKAGASANRAELKEVRATMEEAGRAAREGWEYREVEVHERPDWVSMSVTVIRTDTGETVRTRPMNDTERNRRQLSLVGG